MYTQCSKCETVFKLSADVLRAAGGQVRCGRCGEVFNALARLAEDSNAFTVVESRIAMEQRADSILESTSSLKIAQEVAKDNEEFAPPGVEIAQLKVLDWPDEDTVDSPDSDQEEEEEVDIDIGPNNTPSGDTSMEFTLPPGELDRIFVESKRRSPKLAPIAPVSIPVAAPQPAPQAAPPRSPPPVPPVPPVPPAPPVGPIAPPAVAAVAHIEALPPHPESVAAAVKPELAVNRRVSGLEVPEEIQRDMLAGLGMEADAPPVVLARDAARGSAQRRSLILWACAAVVSCVTLSAQVVHHNQPWFIAHGHGPFGPLLRLLSGALGAPLPAPANLSAYQLRQWGVTGDPSANGTLKVRASILNSAAQLQPYPLLRVTLADRFGKKIGTRDFEPAEYMGKPVARLLSPGERIDAILNILDPGKNAEGFEIDVCLRASDQRIACQNDAAPQSKR